MEMRVIYCPCKIEFAFCTSLKTPNSNFVETLALSIIVVNILPSSLMVIPVPCPVLHQWLGGIWQSFPVWITLLQ